MGLGLLSSSKSSTTNLTKVNETGFNEISGDATSINIDGSMNKLTMTDHNAVKEAFNFSNNALESSNTRVATALSSVGKTTSEAIGAVQAAANADQSQLITNVIKWAVVGVLGYYGLRAIKS